MSNTHSLSLTRPPTRGEWIRERLVALAQLGSTQTLEAEARQGAKDEGVECPDPEPGYYLAFTYWDGQECFCVYASLDPPHSAYERPCT